MWSSTRWRLRARTEGAGALDGPLMSVVPGVVAASQDREMRVNFDQHRVARQAGHRLESIRYAWRVRRKNMLVLSVHIVALARMSYTFVRKGTAL